MKNCRRKSQHYLIDEKTLFTHKNISQHSLQNKSKNTAYIFYRLFAFFLTEKLIYKFLSFEMNIIQSN